MSDLEAKLRRLDEAESATSEALGRLTDERYRLVSIATYPANVLLPELAESISLTSVDTEKTTFPTKFFSQLEVSRWVPG